MITLQPHIAHAFERVRTEINSFASLDEDERAILLNAAHELLILAHARGWEMERATARCLALIGAYAVVNPPASDAAPTTTDQPHASLVTATIDARAPHALPTTAPLAGDTFVVHRGATTTVIAK